VGLTAYLGAVEERKFPYPCWKSIPSRPIQIELSVPRNSASSFDVDVHLPHTHKCIVSTEILLLFTSSRADLGPIQNPIEWVPGALPPGVKRPEREANHSPPTSAKIKTTWIYKTSPACAFI
jgi:hypothetical protein